MAQENPTRTIIGQAFGIDIMVHWTFLFLLVFFAGYGYVQGGNLTGAVLMTGLILALFAFVLLHEYGHSLVAQRLGTEIQDITLLPIGGLARMKSLPERPADEVKIALAGPLVNTVLAAVLGAMRRWRHEGRLHQGLKAGPELLTPAQRARCSGLREDVRAKAGVDT